MEIEGTTYDFPFVSRGAGNEAAAEQELAPPKKTKAWAETLYRAHTSGMDPDGNPIGTVTIVHGRGSDRIPFVAYFTFDAVDDVVVVRGDVPGERGSFKGRTTAVITDGTGAFEGRNDEIDVVSENPKRWG
jgi:hypothetical protein